MQTGDSRRTGTGRVGARGFVRYNWGADVSGPGSYSFPHVLHPKKRPIMTRFALAAGVAASLLFVGAAHAQTTPAEKPGTKPAAPKAATPVKPEKTAKPETKPDAKTATKIKRVTYACDGGVSMVVTYPPEAQAKTGRVKIAMKDTTYFVRPVAGGEKWENKTIKLVFQPKGDEATIEREGKPLAEKCKAAKPGA
jgi:membrane-bound inhibitor of C-type lysozyme